MRKTKAALLSAGFFVVAPGTVVGLIPGLISRWEFRLPLPGWAVAQVVGAVLAVDHRAGVAVRELLAPGLRRGGLGRTGRVRALVRGTHVRRRVRGVPPGGARLAAPAAAVDPDQDGVE
ncbi:hypothetical protein [Amycolatopsis sp. YIM 10]|uniref:hypothetical protein n=1 Tax=Amycolatopsis sp. YIM 10 TaxID=2653857 RepID=UPI001D1482BB|nr:hypothetical protein [Amycolatopsis sp. YIM 10]